MTENLTVIFTNGAETFDASGYVFGVEATFRGISSDYRHADSEATISARFNADLFAFVNVASPRSVFVEIKDGGVPKFYGVVTGRIERTRSVENDGDGDLTIEAIDFGDVLRVPIGDEFIREGYSVAPDDGVDSILVDLLAASGYSIDYSAAYCLDQVGGYYATADKTVYDAITELLFEYGYGWIATPERKIKIIDVSENIANGPRVDDTVARSITTKRQENAVDVVTAQWYVQETKTTRPDGAVGFPLYVEKLPYDSENKPLGVVIQPARYYPPEFEIADDVSQAYTSAAYDYLVKYVELIRNAKPQLIYARDAFIEDSTTGPVVRYVAELGHTSARVVYKNTGTVDGMLVRFAIYGTARLRKALGVVKAAGLGGQGTEEIELNIVDGVAVAERVAKLHARRLSPDALTFSAEVSSALAIEPGQRVTIATDAGDIVADVFEVAERAGEAFVTVSGLAKKADVPAAVVDITVFPGDALASVETAIGNAVTPGDIVEGIDDTASGATTVPEVPTVTAEGTFRGVVVTASTSRYQTGRVRFEAQVAESAGGPWYALDYGANWHGAIGEDTDSATGLFVHSPVPLPVDSSGNAGGLALFYRVRVVTTNETTPTGSWSAIVSATASPVEAGTLAANSIKAGNIQAGVLNAILAEIKEQLVIDAELGYTARLDADKRVRINESGLFIDDFVPSQKYTDVAYENDTYDDEATSIIVNSPAGFEENDLTGWYLLIWDAGYSKQRSIRITGNDSVPGQGLGLVLTFAPQQIGFINDGEPYTLATPTGSWNTVLQLSGDPKIELDNGLSLQQGTGMNSIIVGRGTNTATNTNSINFGVDNAVSGTNAEAFGKANKSTGDASVAIGDFNYAYGKYSNAVGRRNEATAENSTAHGYNNKAQGIDSTAVGSSNKTAGSHGGTFGFANTVNQGGNAGWHISGDTTENRSGYALGIKNTVNGYGSIAAGYGNVVGSAWYTGDCNVGIGFMNTVPGRYNYALGRFITVPAGASGSGTADDCYMVGRSITIAAGLSDILAAGANIQANHAWASVIAQSTSATTTAGTNTVQIGAANQTMWYYAMANRSDARDKSDIEDLPPALGLSFVRALRPRRFRWNYREDYAEDGAFDAEAHSAGTKKRKRWHTGLIAQEVKQALDTAGEDAAFYKDGNVSAEKDALGLDYQELIAVCLQAVKEQDAQIAALTARVETLEAAQK